MIKVHEKVVNKVDWERLHCGATKAFYIFTVVLTLLITGFDSIPLVAQSDVMICTQLGFVWVGRGVKAITNNIPPH